MKDKVYALKKESDEMVQKKERLEKEQIQTQTRLKSAEKLTYLLGGEGERWKVTILEIQEDLSNLIGNQFLAAAIVSYCGPFTGIFR